MDGILSLLSSLRGGGQSNPVGSLGAPQREVALPDQDSTATTSWSQARGHKKRDED